ncbi:hypothetical protein ACWGI0_09450 [Streptomyces sp. NPDC054802]
MKNMNASSLLDWLHDRRRLLESSTVRLVFDNLRAVFDLAVDDSLIPKKHASPNRCRTPSRSEEVAAGQS